MQKLRRSVLLQKGTGDQQQLYWYYMHLYEDLNPVLNVAVKYRRFFNM